MKTFFKGPGKIGQIAESAVDCRNRNRRAAFDQILGFITAHQIHKIKNAGAGKCLEFPCQVELADPHVIGDVIQCK